jgi:hypothetical protein
MCREYFPSVRIEFFIRIRTSLDTIGIAGFSHDFGTLRGNSSAIAEVFDSIGRLKPSILHIIVVALGAALPVLARARTPRNSLLRKFKLNAEEIARELLERTAKEKGATDGKKDESVMGLLRTIYLVDLNLLNSAKLTCSLQLRH